MDYIKNDAGYFTDETIIYKTRKILNLNGIMMKMQESERRLSKKQLEVETICK